MWPIKNRKWPFDARTISNLLVVLIGIICYLVLSNFSAIRVKIGQFVHVVAPFIYAVAIAYLLNTPTRFFEEKVYQDLKHRRGLSILTVYILVFAGILVLLKLILPQVIESVTRLLDNLSYYLNNLNDLVQRVADWLNLNQASVERVIGSYNELVKKVSDVVTQALPQLLDLGVAVGTGLFSAVTALIASIYMLAGKDKLLKQLKKIIYAFIPQPRAAAFLKGCRRANAIFSGFINGKLLDSLIIGFLCFFLTQIVRIRAGVLVSVIVGVTNVIPFFGPLIGAVPCTLILLIMDPFSALKFLILIVALQQFDGNILGPKILGDSTGLSAIWVLVAIVVGGGLFGFIGMLLGVPTFAVLYMGIRDIVDARLNAKGIDENGHPLEQAEENCGKTNECQ